MSAIYTLGDVRKEYDRLDAITGADTREIALSVSSRSIRRLGCFRPGPPPEIVLSVYTLGSENQFLDTIRHEYAHALVWLRHPGEKHGHDAVWREACREVGCRPRATAVPDSVQTFAREQRAKYKLVCRTCGNETYYLREGRIIQALRSGSGSVRCTHCNGDKFDIFIR